MNEPSGRRQRWAEILYRHMVALYPTAFRREYGHDIELLVKDLESDPSVPAWRFWLMLWRDLRSSVLREHLDYVTGGLSMVRGWRPSRADVISRWPFYASVAVLGCECMVYLFGGSIELGERQVMVGIDSTEAAEQARVAIELYAIGALNLLASVAFLLRRSGWGWWLVIGMQVGVFALALIQGVLTDLGWFYVSSLPLVTLFLMFAFRTSPLAGLQPR
jgi:hypothetical protein